MINIICKLIKCDFNDGDNNCTNEEFGRLCLDMHIPEVVVKENDDAIN